MEPGHLCCGNSVYLADMYDCCDGRGFYKHTQFCCGGRVYEKEGDSYDGCCGTTPYHHHNSLCCDGQLYSKRDYTHCCHGSADAVPYNLEFNYCCHGELVDRAPEVVEAIAKAIGDETPAEALEDGTFPDLSTPTDGGCVY